MIQVKIAIVISFRDEARYLPRLFASLSAQTEPADEVLLVDDGSVDASTTLARSFADEHETVTLLVRERTGADALAHANAQDRLAAAPELQGFTWGVAHLAPDNDVVAKMDGDLELPSTLLADVRRAFRDEPRLGITGSSLSVIARDGSATPEHNPPHHVRGPNKFYRAACLSDISPLPVHLGWDTVDELRARRLGWDTHPIPVASGDVLHLRPTGSHDGRLRAYRRWGWCAWGYGAHPLMVLAGAVRRGRSKPYGLGGVNYAVGWAAAGLNRAPRIERETRAFCHQEELARLRAELSGLGRTRTRSSRRP